MQKTGTLYIVATPIGNLSDITLRALEVLRNVDMVLCEDTRVTRKLLNHYKIKKPLLSYHQHSKISKIDKIAKMLEEGQDLALVSDAGTPGVSDPGNELIMRLPEQINLISIEKNVKIIPVPGASSLTAILSVAGVDVSKFLFLGFLPHKKGRKTLIEKIKESAYPVVIFESKFRLLKLLENFLEEEMHIVVGREMTKMYEEIVRGTAKEVVEYFSENPGKLKGEFVLIIAPKKSKP